MTRAWLYRGGPSPDLPDDAGAGEVVRWYRLARGLTQCDAARLLNMSQSRLSKIEVGAQGLSDVRDIRLIAQRLDIPPERLGVVSARSEALSLLSDAVQESQREWLAARRAFVHDRSLLSDLAAGLIDAERLDGGSAVTRDQWIPATPVPLEDLRL